MRARVFVCECVHVRLLDRLSPAVHLSWFLGAQLMTCNYIATLLSHPTGASWSRTLQLPHFNAFLALSHSQQNHNDGILRQKREKVLVAEKNKIKSIFVFYNWNFFILYVYVLYNLL